MDYSKQNQMPPPQPTAGYPAPQQQYPVTAPYSMPPQQPWSTGLCDCFDDFNNCKCSTFFREFLLISNELHLTYVTLVNKSMTMQFFVFAGCLTCWCPCITFGQIAEIVDRGTTCKCLL
jgi:hypothetical protein